MNDVLLTLSQALQLVAIAPCVFVIVFLLCNGIRRVENILPSIYFLSLSCSFLLPLLEFVEDPVLHSRIMAALLFGENLTVPLSYLLIMQFVQGRVPTSAHWLILALPVIGGTPFVIAMLYASEVCFDKSDCYPTSSLRMLYSIFSSALVFLLLIYRLATKTAGMAVDDEDRKHKYWLIISLVVLNLMLAMMDLLVVGGKLNATNVLLASTIIRITFIYLVLTSIFALFYEMFEVETADGHIRPRTVEQDQQTVLKIRDLLEKQGIYREMGLTRKAMAEKLGLSEQQASRIINAYFRKNFNELINTHRIEEAKRRLTNEETAITVIAFEVGFNSIASFNRVFKELVGSSPTEFREANTSAAS